MASTSGGGAERGGGAQRNTFRLDSSVARALDMNSASGDPEGARRRVLSARLRGHEPPSGGSGAGDDSYETVDSSSYLSASRSGTSVSSSEYTYTVSYSYEEASSGEAGSGTPRVALAASFDSAVGLRGRASLSRSRSRSASPLPSPRSKPLSGKKRRAYRVRVRRHDTLQRHKRQLPPRDWGTTEVLAGASDDPDSPAHPVAPEVVVKGTSPESSGLPNFAGLRNATVASSLHKVCRGIYADTIREFLDTEEQSQGVTDPVFIRHLRALSSILLRVNDLASDDIVNPQVMCGVVEDVYHLQQQWEVYWPWKTYIVRLLLVLSKASRLIQTFLPAGLPVTSELNTSVASITRITSSPVSPAVPAFPAIPPDANVAQQLMRRHVHTADDLAEYSSGDDDTGGHSRSHSSVGPLVSPTCSEDMYRSADELAFRAADDLSVNDVQSRVRRESTDSRRSRRASIDSALDAAHGQILEDVAAHLIEMRTSKEMEMAVAAGRDTPTPPHPVLPDDRPSAVPFGLRGQFKPASSTPDLFLKAAPPDAHRQLEEIAHQDASPPAASAINLSAKKTLHARLAHRERGLRRSGSGVLAYHVAAIDKDAHSAIHSAGSEEREAALMDALDLGRQATTITHTRSRENLLSPRGGGAPKAPASLQKSPSGADAPRQTWWGLEMHEQTPLARDRGHTEPPSGDVCIGDTEGARKGGGDAVAPPPLIVCRICEQDVPEPMLVEHTRYCKEIAMAEMKTTVCDQKLAQHVAVLDTVAALPEESSANRYVLGSIVEMVREVMASDDFTVVMRLKNKISCVQQLLQLDEAHQTRMEEIRKATQHSGELPVVTSGSLDEQLGAVHRLLVGKAKNLEQAAITAEKEAATVATADDESAPTPPTATPPISSLPSSSSVHTSPGTTPLAGSPVNSPPRAPNAGHRRGSGLMPSPDPSVSSVGSGAPRTDDDSMLVEDDKLVHPAVTKLRRRRRRTLSMSMPTVRDFDLVRPLSSGAFGRVLLVRKKATGDLFALKVLRKADMVRKNQLNHVIQEQNILTKTNNPHLVRLYYSFESERNLHLVTEYMPGGDVSALLHDWKYFDEDHARIYAAEVVLALGYLHHKHIVHRDLKPANLLISAQGHLKLTDFGLSSAGVFNRTERAHRHHKHSHGHARRKRLFRHRYHRPADSETLTGTSSRDASAEELPKLQVSSRISAGEPRSARAMLRTALSPRDQTYPNPESPSALPIVGGVARRASLAISPSTHRARAFGPDTAQSNGRTMSDRTSSLETLDDDPGDVFSGSTDVLMSTGATTDSRQPSSSRNLDEISSLSEVSSSSSSDEHLSGSGDDGDDGDDVAHPVVVVRGEGEISPAASSASVAIPSNNDTPSFVAATAPSRHTTRETQPQFTSPRVMVPRPEMHESQDFARFKLSLRSPARGKGRVSLVIPGAPGAGASPRLSALATPARAPPSNAIPIDAGNSAAGNSGRVHSGSDFPTDSFNSMSWTPTNPVMPPTPTAGAGNSTSKRKNGQRYSFVGTPDYLAPEIILGTGHGRCVDWWALGVILFELLTGVPPFNDETPLLIFENILDRRIDWPDVPEDMSEEARDLISCLLTVDPTHRLGVRGASQVKAHPFFRGIDWERLLEMDGPFVPSPDVDYAWDRKELDVDEGVTIEELLEGDFSLITETSDADVQDSVDSLNVQHAWGIWNWVGVDALVDLMEDTSALTQTPTGGGKRASFHPPEDGEEEGAPSE